MKLYLDEDISPRVAERLREKGIDAVSTREVRMIGVSDEEQLDRAVSEGRVMITRNRNDFIALTAQFFQDVKPHHGLLIVPYSLPGYDFSLLANLFYEYIQKHPKGLESYTIEFVSKGKG